MRAISDRFASRARAAAHIAFDRLPPASLRRPTQPVDRRARAAGGALLETVSRELPRREAFERLLRFLRRLAARARLRRLLQGRVERRFDLRRGAYYYVELPVGEFRTAERVLERRPRLLGALHELAAPDAWEAIEDPRFRAEAPVSFFFNHRYHAISWRQPEGTLLCGACERVFASRYCGDCGTGLCEACLAAGGHEAAAHRVLKVRGSVEGAIAGLWAAWAELEAQQGQ